MHLLSSNLNSYIFESRIREFIIFKEQLTGELEMIDRKQWSKVNFSALTQSKTRGVLIFKISSAFPGVDRRQRLQNWKRYLDSHGLSTLATFDLVPQASHDAGQMWVLSLSLAVDWAEILIEMTFLTLIPGWNPLLVYIISLRVCKFDVIMIACVCVREGKREGEKEKDSGKRRRELHWSSSARLCRCIGAIARIASASWRAWAAGYLFTAWSMSALRKGGMKIFHLAYKNPYKTIERVIHTLHWSPQPHFPEASLAHVHYKKENRKAGGREKALSVEKLAQGLVDITETHSHCWLLWGKKVVFESRLEFRSVNKRKEFKVKKRKKSGIIILSSSRHILI